MGRKGPACPSFSIFLFGSSANFAGVAVQVRSAEDTRCGIVWIFVMFKVVRTVDNVELKVTYSMKSIFPPPMLSTRDLVWGMKTLL